MTTPQPQCPECEKLNKVIKESQKIGEFLDWLSQQDIELCKNEKKSEENNWVAGYYPIRVQFEDLLAEYFKIDMEKVEKERSALLEWIQEQNE